MASDLKFSSINSVERTAKLRFAHLMFRVLQRFKAYATHSMSIGTWEASQTWGGDNTSRALFFLEKEEIF